MIPWTDVILATKWYLAIFILGFLGWVVLLPYAKKLPARGYGAGRAVGLILLGSLSWFLATLNIFDFTGQNLWVIVFFFVLVIWKKKDEVLATIKENWKEILISEIVYLVLFVIALAMKVHKPGITDIEKYMDIAFLNATMRTTSGVPVDPWYAGSVINYYYVGHWFVAMVAKMTSIASNYAFNLGYATVMMIAGSNIVLAGWSLSKKVFGGVLAVFLALLSSNIHPLLAWIHETPNYFFFSSGRFIDQVINEYPFYSFVVGDLHAHSLGLILATTSVVASIFLLQREKLDYYVVVFMGFLVGMMSSVNAFDVINLGLFSGIALFVYWLRNKPSIKSGFKILLAFAVPALIPFALFKSNFVNPVGGIGFDFMKTPITHVLMQFGIFFFIIFVGLATCAFIFRKKIKYFLSSLGEFGSVKGLLLFVGSITPETIVLFCVLLSGFILVILPEIAFFKDIYFTQNPPYARANTVFKVWYEAWMLLALSAGVVGALLHGWLSKKYSMRGKVIAVLILALPVSVGLYGDTVGWRTMNDSLPNTLDGLDYTRHFVGPQDYDIVQWARKNISGQPVVLEATGQSYSTYNWFSAFTGLPTIIGWQSHEWGWRYEKEAWNKVALKMGQVESIYKTKDPQTLKSMVNIAGISYVLVSQNEKSLYGVQDDVMKKAFGDPVFNSGRSALYKTGFTDKNM